MRNILQRHRRFSREARLFGRRVFCRCELCCLEYGRMLYAKVSGQPIRFRRIPGFSGNFSPRYRIPGGGRYPLRRNPGGRR